MNRLVRPLEVTYHQLSRARRRLYASGYLRVRKLPRPVVSVGNIAFGGTGKTPVVIALAKWLVRRGYRPVVLTRGYGRVGAAEQSLVTSDDTSVFGDEPVLIRRAAAVPVVVGADRYRSGSWWLERDDCDVFLLDDGFQHVQLARDFDLVIDDPAAPLLRESRPALAEADVILRRHRDGETSHEAGGIRVFDLEVIPTHWSWRGSEHALGELRDRRMIAFAGLARNEQFFDALADAGAIVEKRLRFRDHHRYTALDLETIQRAAIDVGCELIITTEKDSVKISDDRIAVLHVEAVIDRDEELFALLEQAIAPRRGPAV